MSIWVGSPATGTLTYNGIAFDGAMDINVREEPVWDDANLAVKYMRITIDVSGVLITDGNPGTATDTTMKNLRVRLSRSGANMQFTGEGFGTDLRINNAAGPIKDVAGGPKPQVLQWDDLGDGRAADIHWSCVIHVPECLYEARYQGIASINWAVTHSIDDGYLTRTINGHIEIAQQQNPNTNTISDSADLYFFNMFQAEPTGFKRRVSRSTNQQKNRVDFTITDTQIRSKNPFPDYFVDISAKHRVSWNRSKAARFGSNFTMNCELAEKTPPIWAWVVFVTMLRQRASRAIRNRRYVMLESLTVDEDIFSWKSSFSAQWRFLSCIDKFISDSGLFTPIEGTDWNKWRTSLRQTAFNPYGSREIKHDATMDTIIDLCSSPTIPTYATNGREVPWARPELRGVLVNQPPPPDQSYMSYDLAVVNQKEAEVARHSYLQAPTSESATGFPLERGGYDGGQDNIVSDVVQDSGGARNSFWLVGSAVRAGYQVARPAVTNVAGQTPTPAGGWHSQRVLGNYFGLPVYSAKFAYRYMLPQTPHGVSAPDKVDECVLGSREEAKPPRVDSPGDSMTRD